MDISLEKNEKIHKNNMSNNTDYTLNFQRDVSKGSYH